MPVEANTGGPDSFGYEWTDSKDPAPKVNYNWISATGGTNTFVTGDDSYGGPYNIGFTFSFYGNSYSQFYVDSNGLIYFTDPFSSNLGNDPIPTAVPPDNFIAVLWDDLNPSEYFPSGTIYYQLFGSAPNRYLVVEWNNIYFYFPNSNDQITFEAILYEAGGEIKLQYQDVSGSDPIKDFGGSATVGIEDSTGTQGLQYSNNQAIITNNLAISFGKSKPGKIDGLNIVDGFGPKGNICGAGLPINFQVIASDPNGYTDIDRVIINLDYLGENLSYIWRQQNELFEETGDINGYGDIVSTADDSKHDSADTWTLDFKIVFDWDFPHENIFGCMVRTWDSTEIMLTKYFIDLVRVESDVELIGQTAIISDNQGPISSGGWVKRDETLNWSGLTVVYEGTTDGYPPDTDFDIIVTRLDTGEFWIDRESSGQPFVIYMPAESESDIQTISYKVSIKDLPAGGQDISNLPTYELKIDGLAPEPPTNIIVHADSIQDAQTTADDDTTIYVTWDSVASEHSGIGGYYYSFTNNETTSEGLWATDTFTALTDAVEGVNYIYVWAQDYVGNIGYASYETIIIDLNEPIIINYTPTADEWQKHRSINCELNIKDINETGGMGSGIDRNHVQYSVSTSGIANFGAWTYADRITDQTITDNGNEVTMFTAVAELNFKEGENNYVKWQVEDLAGNGYVETDALQIKVDTQEVLYSNPSPDPNEWLVVESDKDLTCEITIGDGVGSGVKAASIEYCYSINGVEDYGEWINAGQTRDSTEIECEVEIPFKMGDNNYIKWRAMDLAGNGYTESNDLQVLINTVPTPIITLPKEGTEFTTKDLINFNAFQTSDLDGDELKLFWQSNISGSISTGVVFSVKIYPGYHGITLYVNDGNGHNVSTMVNISVLDMDKDTDSDGIPDLTDTDDDNDGLLDIDEFVMKTDPLDSDTDGDNVDDGTDQFPLNSREWEDTDGDKIGNNADLDDDEDGYPDSIDAYPTDPSRHSKDAGDDNSYLILGLIGIIIVVVLIIAMWMYIKNKRAEEEKMELEMAGIMPSTGLPPMGAEQPVIEYFPQHPVTYYGLQPPVTAAQQPYGAGAPQFALQPSPSQPQYQQQYQLPPAQFQEPPPPQPPMSMQQQSQELQQITPPPSPQSPTGSVDYTNYSAQPMQQDYQQLPPPPNAGGTGEGTTSPYYNELEQLKQKYARGEITEDEYLQKKGQLDRTYSI